MINPRLLWRFLVGGLIAVLLVVAAPGRPGGGHSHPDGFSMTLAGGGEVVFHWRFAGGADGRGKIELMPVADGDSADFATSAVMYDADTEEADFAGTGWRMCSFAAGRLPAGMTYAYRVWDGISWSEITRLSTGTAAAGSRFSFLVFGDSQSHNYGLWGKTLKAAFERNEQAAFFTVVGDMVDTGGNPGQWQEWFNAGWPVMKSLPLVPVPGNHETYNGNGRAVYPVYLRGLFGLPGDSQPAGLTGVYSFDFGDAHFVVLDSQIDELSGEIPDLAERQREWLAADLSGTSRKWRVVFMHKPMYGRGNRDWGAKLRHWWEDLLVAGRVDIVFSGHEHVYSRTRPLLPDGCDPAERGVVYVTCGRSGEKTYKGVRTGQFDEVFFNPLGQPNYLVVEVGKQLVVSAYTLDGQMIDTFTVAG
ncbi:MAG: metallophosphoesterase [Negativicutes bacterium]|nr:metallophosphoesterase [Negativicutes bacterium]